MTTEGAAILDLRFRTVVERLDAAGRLLKIQDRVDPYLEAGGILKKLDGDMALYFERVGDYSIPIVANVVVSAANTKAVFGMDVPELRALMVRAFSTPIDPVVVESGPCQQMVKTEGIDLERALPILFHAPNDAGKFITGGIVVIRDPETGVHNASFHRLQIIGPDRTGIKIDAGRHLGYVYEKYQRRNEAMPIAVLLGPDLSMFYAAVGSGSQLPLDMDEYRIASGLLGRPLELVPCRTVPVVVPAETEIVLEGLVSPTETVHEGPFVEFLQLYSEAGPSPVVQITALTHRRNPLYYSCLAGIHGGMLRKYLDEAAFLKALRQSVPIVSDVELTPVASAKFHAIIQVKKTSPRDDGLQRNAIFAAFAAQKDLDLVIVVDDDIDVHNPADVEWAMLMRFNATNDVMIMNGARTHEYLRIADHGIRGKIAFDATVPFDQRKRYERVKFLDVQLDRYRMTNAPSGLVFDRQASLI